MLSPAKRHLLAHYAQRHGTPLLLFSPGTFSRQYARLRKALPRVRCHYALKALPYVTCLEVIAAAGGHIEVATTGEMRFVAQHAPQLLKEGLYTHPIKTPADVEVALSLGLHTVVIDNLAELQKLLPYRNSLKLLIRLAFPNTEAQCNLSRKFGVLPKDAEALIRAAQEGGFTLLGCCFHVGSQMPSPAMHVAAIEACAVLYSWAARTLNLQFSVLDIGGGFPAMAQPGYMDIEEYCAPLQAALEMHFADVELWAEPGRVLAASSMVSVAQIIGKAWRDAVLWYYLDDGVYSSYSGNIYDGTNLRIKPLQSSQGESYPTLFAGPTCDSIDVIGTDPEPVPELEIGDYVYCENIGAYSWASRSSFNHVKEVQIIEVPFCWHDEERASSGLLPAEALLLEGPF